MRSRSLPHLPIFDVGLPEVPPRSRLFALPPAGLGTDRVESLTSYLTRLARAHAVSPRRLIREELVAASQDPDRLTSAARRAASLATLDGLDEYAQAFAALTATLTTVASVRYLTLLPLAGVLPRCGSGVTAAHPRWCRECLAEARSAMSRPLVWSLALYQVCHRHRRPLAATCACCGKLQPFLPRFPDLAHCAHCGGDLSVGPPEEISPAESGLWIAESLADLVAHLPELDGVDTWKRFAAFLGEAVGTLAEGSRAGLCRQLGMDRSTIDNWLIRQARPSLPQLLTVAYCLGIRPAALLMGSECPQAARKRLGAGACRDGPVRLAGTERWRAGKALAQLASDPADGRALADVARELGLSRWELKYWFPEACAVISAKHALAHRRAAVEHRRADYELVARIVRDSVGRGEYPGRRKINETLRSLHLSLARSDMLAAYRRAVKAYVPK